MGDERLVIYLRELVVRDEVPCRFIERIQDYLTGRADTKDVLCYLRPGGLRFLLEKMENPDLSQLRVILENERGRENKN